MTMASHHDRAKAPQRGRIDKRRAVMDAARAVFLRDGFSAATIDAIATEAGVSKQTIYNHMQDKETLFLAVVDETLENASAAALETVEGFPEKPVDLETELVELGWQLVRSFLEQNAAALRRILNAEAGRYPHLVAAWRKRGPGRVSDALANRFAQLGRAGYLDVEDPDQAARQFMALVTYDPQLYSALGTLELDDQRLETAVNAAVWTFIRAYAVR